MPRFYSSTAGGDFTAAGSSSPGVPGQQPAPKPVSEGPEAAPLPQQAPANDEPGMVLEEDVASDGRDEKGEEMIRDLPKRPELSELPEPSGQLDSKRQAQSPTHSRDDKR